MASKAKEQRIAFAFACHVLETRRPLNLRTVYEDLSESGIVLRVDPFADDRLESRLRETIAMLKKVYEIVSIRNVERKEHFARICAAFRSANPDEWKDGLAFYQSKSESAMS